MKTKKNNTTNIVKFQTIVTRNYVDIIINLFDLIIN